MERKEVTFIEERLIYIQAGKSLYVIPPLGITCTMTTGGRARLDKCQEMANAGIKGVSSLIDGLEQTHDQLRALKALSQRC